MSTATILVVDDERLICWSIQQTLQAAGYEVSVAETAAEAMSRFREIRPDVVFLDICLPDGNGMALLRRIKQEQPQHTAVVVMTAHGEAGTGDEAIRLGACAYLAKPFEFARLERVVTEALSGRSAEADEPMR